MSHLDRLLLTLAIIFISLTLGYYFRRISEKGKIKIPPAVLDNLRARLQTSAIFFLIPLSAMLSLWGLPQPESNLLALPMLGIASYIWGGMLALWAGRLLKMDRRQLGAFYCCGTFTNLGAIGGLVCLLFLGENTIALVALYRLLEEVFYFSVSFPIAKWYGETSPGASLSFKNFKFNPVLGIILAALCSGICLNLGGIPRPEIFGLAASASMLMATIFFLFAIGLTLRLSRLFIFARAGMVICAIKFIGCPLMVVALAVAMGYGAFDNDIALKTVAILASMPVAMTALIPPSLFHLDVDLANACWIFSTLGLILVLPLLMILLPLL